MAGRKEEYKDSSRGVPESLANPHYGKLCREIKKIVEEIGKLKGKKKRENLPKLIELIEERKALLKMRNVTPSIIPNPIYKRLEYVRYADD